MATVNVIHAGPTGFDYAIFGDHSPINSQYFQQQLSYFSDSLNDMGRRFMEGSREIYDRLNNSEALRMARAAMRTVRGVFHPNMIVPLETLEDLRSAQPLMQRYVMAEPMLREKFHRQLVDGYSSTYVDVDPGCIGSNHYDYRRVMTGIVQDTVTEDGEDGWVSHNYYDEDRGDDRDLDSGEKFAILNTWDIVKMFVNSGRDPTDIFAK